MWGMEELHNNLSSMVWTVKFWGLWWSEHVVGSGRHWWGISWIERGWWILGK